MRALRAMDIDFCLVRERIASRFHARQTGVLQSDLADFRFGDWDERAFWASFREALGRGEFDPFIYRSGPDQMACFWADCHRHTLAGRFDHLIRAWARG